MKGSKCLGVGKLTAQVKESRSRRQCLQWKFYNFTMLQALVMTLKKITASSRNYDFQKGRENEGLDGSFPELQLLSLWVFCWLSLDRGRAGGRIL